MTIMCYERPISIKESRGRVAFINLLFYFTESKHKIKEFALYKEAFTRKMERYYN